MVKIMDIHNSFKEQADIWRRQKTMILYGLPGASNLHLLFMTEHYQKRISSSRFLGEIWKAAGDNGGQLSAFIFSWDTIAHCFQKKFFGDRHFSDIMQFMSDFIVVLVTCGSEEEAQKIAHSLVEERLAACVNVISPVRSIYRWEGKILDEKEWILFAFARILCSLLQRGMARRPRSSS